MKYIIKTYLLFALFVLCAIRVGAQVYIDGGAVTGHNSAMLEVVSTSKGFLMPRMTQSNRNAISSPETGLMIFQTDNDKGIYYYNGSQWKYWDLTDENWELPGNDAADTNFLGTIDNQPLRFRVNNTHAGLLSKDNTFFGYRAGNLSLTGVDNTAFGYNSLSSVTSGKGNTALGTNALNRNTTGSYNTAIGVQALEHNVGGSYNTALGARAMLYNTYANHNVAIGSYALYWQSYSNGNTPWSTDNVAVGNFCLYSNDPTSATNGRQNTAAGDSAMYYNATGSYNTALGFKALLSDTSGEYNTALGYGALMSSKRKSINSAAGYYALGYDTAGSRNVAVGALAGTEDTLGIYNIFLGYNANTGDTLDNCIAIAGEGNLAITSHNMVRFGNSADTSIGGQVAWTTVSDKRLKTSIRADVPGMDFIMRLKPVYYTLNIEKENEITGFVSNSETMKKSVAASRKRIRTGLLAQDVYAAAKSVNYDFYGVDKPDNPDNLWGIRYALFTVPLIKAVQEQELQISENRKKIAALKRKLAQLQYVKRQLLEIKTKDNNR